MRPKPFSRKYFSVFFVFPQFSECEREEFFSFTLPSLLNVPSIINPAKIHNLWEILNWLGDAAKNDGSENAESFFLVHTYIKKFKTYPNRILWIITYKYLIPFSGPSETPPPSLLILNQINHKRRSEYTSIKTKLTNFVRLYPFDSFSWMLITHRLVQI